LYVYFDESGLSGLADSDIERKSEPSSLIGPSSVSTIMAIRRFSSVLGMVFESRLLVSIATDFPYLAWTKAVFFHQSSGAISPICRQFPVCVFGFRDELTGISMSFNYDFIIELAQFFGD
jgi:hypothetical protein